MPLLKKVRVLAAKHETVLGTAIAVDATDAAFNAFDLECQGNFEFHERSMQGSMSRLPGVIGTRAGTMTFDRAFWRRSRRDAGMGRRVVTRLRVRGLGITNRNFSSAIGSAINDSWKRG